MTSDNSAIARAFVEAIPSGVLPAELIADDFTAWTTSSGEMSGDRMRGGLGLLPRIFAQPMRIDIEAVTAQNDRVVIEAESHGPLINGDEYRNRYVFVVQLRDGRVTRFAEHNNPIVVREKLGPLMQAAMAGAEARA